MQLFTEEVLYLMEAKFVFFNRKEEYVGLKINYNGISIPGKNVNNVKNFKQRDLKKP
jgi:hypothetical protein